MSGGIMRHARSAGKSGSDQKQKVVLSSFWKPQTASLTASYEDVVKDGKSFRDGELIKQCAVKMAQVFGEEKVAKVARKFESVSLSHQRVSRRVCEINEQVSLKLKDVLKNCKHFNWLWTRVQTSVT
jgi:leucyl aminopeptidase (aminopeptidase T)